MHDSIFTIHQYEIPFENYGDEITISPWGDVHKFSSMCHDRKWREYLDWAKSVKNIYFLGMGDYMDLMSGSEREAFNSIIYKLHDETKYTMDDVAEERIRVFGDELDFMKDKIIGLIEGNHFYQFPTNITSTQKLCERLRCRYLGANAFIRLVFIHTKDLNRKHYLDIWAHHGLGASRLLGGSINRVQQMESIAQADIYLMGHDHKKSVGMMSRLWLHGRKPKLLNKKIIFARTGSFLKAYDPDKSSYIVKRQYRPADLGTVSITVTPRCNNINGLKVRELDLNATL